MTCFLFNVNSFGKWTVSKFVSTIFLPNLLLRMGINGRQTTSGVKFDHEFDFSVPDFLCDQKFWKLDHDFMYFSQFSAGHAQKRPEFYFRSNFKPQI